MRSRRKPVSRLAGTAAALAVLVPAAVAVAPSAVADSGGVCSVGCAGDIYFYDNGDLVTLSDNKADGHGVIGWISVQQADGSYKPFPRIYLGSGKDTATAVTQDVLREASRVKLTVCWIDGARGTPFNCGFRYISG
ncbi:hypothetical protein [Terracoccus luteus]|uniref:Secreted protein n=1 Tax=Terracoccus luteus TaxID=53356 RepID=A0A839PXJ5_9MICO|nr:hypothetical protein [Terracoccus luteus]MBB2988079.1 hypothetical protein [Terracoccus luteus]MCP2173730.1 hypothetical protein [Terracoccus luteus]